MANAASCRQIIELKTGGPEAVDRSRTAAVLAAYFHAEHVRTFRKMAWRRLALLALVWVLAGMLTSVISRNALLGGLAVLIGVGGVASVAEWRAAEQLNELLEGPAKRLAVVRSIPASVPHEAEGPH